MRYNWRQSWLGKNQNDLFKRANFENVTFHTEVMTDSKRNQDLGMMAKRILVSAITKKEWTPVKKTIKATKTLFLHMFGSF